MSFLRNPAWVASLNSTTVISGGGGGGGGSDPSSITGLIAWWKAGSISGADGDRIATWPDSSGLGNDLTQPTAGSQPTLRTAFVNAQNAVDFGILHASNFMMAPNFLSGVVTAAEIMFILKVASESSANYGLNSFTAPTDTCAYPFNGDNLIYEQFGSSVRRSSIVHPTVLTAWHSYGISASSSAWSCRMNGTQMAAFGSNTVSFSTTPRLCLTGGVTRDCHIAEIVFYNKVLSSTERNTLRDYFNPKYGLSIV